MAIFESNLVQVSSVTTSAKLVWDPSNTSTTTFGSLGLVPGAPSFPNPATLRDVTIVNAGAVPVFIGYGTAITASGSGTALKVPAGGQVTIQGYSTVAGTTTDRIYAITASGTTSVEVGLGSVVSVD